MTSELVRMMDTPTTSELAAFLDCDSDEELIACMDDDGHIPTCAGYWYRLDCGMLSFNTVDDDETETRRD